MKETTALGAAMVAMTGIGFYGSMEEAFTATDSHYELFEPGENQTRYREVYKGLWKGILK
jgi:glycerol kinase